MHIITFSGVSHWIILDFLERMSIQVFSKRAFLSAIVFLSSFFFTAYIICTLKGRSSRQHLWSCPISSVYMEMVKLRQNLRLLSFLKELLMKLATDNQQLARQHNRITLLPTQLLSGDTWVPRTAVYMWYISKHHWVWNDSLSFHKQHMHKTSGTANTSLLLLKKTK